MRVLHVIPTIALEHGGPSQAVRVMARSIAARGADVNVVSTNFGTPEGSSDPDRLSERWEDGVLYRLFPQTKGSRWNFSVPLTRWLFQHAREYDLAHVHAPFCYPTLPGCLASRLFGVPYLYRTIGALDPWSMGQRSWKKWPYFLLLERPNMRGAFAVHVTSEAERQAVLALGSLPEKTVVIPVGVPPAAVSPSHRRPPKQPPLRVLFLGRLHEKKGVPLLVDAVRALRNEQLDVTLTVAGSGEPGYVDSLRAHAESAGVASAVTFVGFVTGEAKSSLLAGSHVLALPAYDENFGISVVEAMAHGLPVVISEAVGIATEVLESQAGIVCSTGDSASLAEGLRRMLSPEMRASCAQGGLALVAGRFSVEATSAALFSLYERAALSRQRDRSSKP